MPSPIGHSLIGAAIGAAWFLPRHRREPLLRALWTSRWPLLGCAAAANGPDIDFVPGLWIGQLNAFHYGLTHSIGWVLLVATGLWLLARAARPRVTAALFLLLVLLLGSHLAADYLCEDRSAPYGIPALWPFDASRHIAPRTLFAAMNKDNAGEVFTAANLPAALREVAVGGTLLLTALALPRYSRRLPRRRVSAIL